jgi:hypothetical protein
MLAGAFHCAGAIDLARASAAGWSAGYAAMLGHAVEDTAGLVQAAAGEEQFDDTLLVSRPLLDLVEVTPLGVDRIISFFV